MDKTILVVEDETPLLDAIKKKLENNGLRVLTARTSEQAISYLEELQKIDGIWLDHYLLGSANGIDLVVKLKESGSRWNALPIFVVSNTASDDKVSAYIELGVTKYFVKSNYRLSQIVESILNYFNHESTKQ